MATKPKPALTPKQERFCREYCVDHNATQAAVRAGYTKRSAQVTSSRLLSNAMVHARVVELEAPVLKELDISKERVLREFALMGFGRINKVVEVDERGVHAIPWAKVSEDDLAAVQEASETVTAGGGSIRIKMHDKCPALTKLGEHLGLWKGNDLPAGVVEIRVNLVPVGESRDGK